mgnify:CR=1 FL=1
MKISYKVIDHLKDNKCLMSIFRRHFAFGLLLTCATLLSFAITSHHAYAQQGLELEKGCDPNFMETLVKKAEMEAFRDLAMAQSQIKKPDSVFQFTCFDRMLSQATAVAIFPEPDPQTDPDERERINRMRLASILNKSIKPIIQEHLGSNYYHFMLGGYPLGQDDGASDDDITASNPQFESVVGDPDDGERRDEYRCSQMHKVWETATCIDFALGDFFLSSSAYTDIQPSWPDHETVSTMPEIKSLGTGGGPPPVQWTGTRVVRHTATCAEANADGNPNEESRWTEMANIAFNWNDENENGIIDCGAGPDDCEEIYEFRGYLDPDLPPDYEGEIDDDGGSTAPQVDEPWFELLEPEACNEPIKTGLKYTLGGGDGQQEVEDAFCSNPGCTYDGEGSCTSGS